MPSPTVYVAGFSALIVASTVAWGFYWKSEAAIERVRVTSLTSERDSALGAVETIKDINTEQTKTLNTVLQMNEKAQETTNEYHERLMAADRKTAEAIQALDKMQLTEHYDALAYPLQRGDAARDRVTNILCRAWGSWADDDPSCRQPEDNGDTETADRPSNRPRPATDGTASGSNDN